MTQRTLSDTPPETIPEEMFAHGPFSPLFHQAAELVGKRWTAAIIYSIFHGLNRFSNLVKAIPGVSSRMLAERLKELEREGIIERRVFAATPVRIEYALTEKGLALREVFMALNKWANTWNPRPTD